MRALAFKSNTSSAPRARIGWCQLSGFEYEYSRSANTWPKARPRSVSLECSHRARRTDASAPCSFAGRTSTASMNAGTSFRTVVYVVAR